MNGDDWDPSMNRHVVRWTIIDSVEYFLLIILLFFSYLFSTLISCFSIKYTAVVELIKDEGSWKS